MTRRSRRKRSVKRRLAALETDTESADARPFGRIAASYDADTDTYYNADGNVILRAHDEQIVLVPSDEELRRLFDFDGEERGGGRP